MEGGKRKERKKDGEINLRVDVSARIGTDAYTCIRRGAY